MLYSAHDTQVANTMFVLDPYEYDFTHVPYASQIFFELYYNEDCLKEGRGEACFEVETLYNGQNLSYKTCPGEKRCNYVDFQKYMDEILIQEGIDELCMQA